MSHLRPALVLTLLFTLITGLLYPLGLTAFGQFFLPAEANGSLIRVGERVIGSALIGQSFTRADYFHGRPSATGANPYDASASSGSNLGPSSKALVEAVKARAEALGPGPQPADLVTASASGLDPDISPAAARAQVARVAAQRGLDPAKVAALVDQTVTPRAFGLFGEPRVNVLALNLALDGLKD